MYCIHLPTSPKCYDLGEVYTAPFFCTGPNSCRPGFHLFPRKDYLRSILVEQLETQYVEKHPAEGDTPGFYTLQAVEVSFDRRDVHADRENKYRVREFRVEAVFNVVMTRDEVLNSAG